MGVRYDRRRVYQPGATHTRAIVHFHSDTGFDGIVNGSHPDIGRIVSVSTSKAFGGAAGTFSITIKKPKDMSASQSFLRLWPDPEDTWVRIAFVVDGQTIMSMWGVIDSISEDVSRSAEGGRSETYSIAGRDFGKVFEEIKPWVNNYSGNVPNSMGAFVHAASNHIQGNPADFTRSILDIWLNNSAIVEKQWELPISLGAGTFYNILNRSTIQDMNRGNGETVDASRLWPTGSSLWEFLQDRSNGLMNELWVDLAPDPADIKNLAALKPAIYLRERMFKTREDSRRWEQLRTRVLLLGDVTHRAVTKGGAANRFNYWTLRGGMLGSGMHPWILPGPRPYIPGGFPIINKESIRKHGVRKWEQSTPYLPFNNPSTGSTYLTLAANWLKRAHDWYAIAPMQLSGTLTTSRIFPEIRIGEKLKEVHPDGVVYYYVEGVDHTWSYPGAGSSILTVTRGEFEGDNLLETLYRDYDAPSRTARDFYVTAVVANASESTSVLTTDGIDADKSLNDLIQQLADGGRFSSGGQPRGRVTELGDEATIAGGLAIGAPEQEAGALAEEPEGLPSEGSGYYRDVPADPEMIPAIDDALSAQANAIIEGTTQDVVPQESVPTEAELANPLPQESLENNRPIVTPPDDGLDVVLQPSDDPLLGLGDEELGL